MIKLAVKHMLCFYSIPFRSYKTHFTSHVPQVCLPILQCLAKVFSPLNSHQVRIGCLQMALTQIVPASILTANQYALKVSFQVKFNIDQQSLRKKSIMTNVSSISVQPFRTSPLSNNSLLQYQL